MIRLSYLLASVCVNAYFLLAALANVAYLHAATKRPAVKGSPFVSVIVPARNEARSIRRCLKSLLSQDYEGYEVIVVDDQSEDDTAAIVAALQADHPRLRLVRGAPLPPGWLGKPHALWQGAAVARGEILVLTDADTAHGPRSVSWAVTNLEAHRAAMLSGYLRQEYGSFGEALVVPTMYAAMLLIPLFLVERLHSPRLALAIGQYVAIRREALDRVGGFEAIRDSIVDDMSMAALVKENGYRTVFLDAEDAARCRLYTGYRDAFDGIERSVYSSLGAHPLTVAAVAAIVLGFIVAPVLFALGSLARVQAPAGLVTASVALFALQWGIVAADRNAPLWAFILYPLVFLSLLVILIASMLSTGYGRGVYWKGRLVRVPRRPRVAGRSRMAEPGRTSGGTRP